MWLTILSTVLADPESSAAPPDAAAILTGGDVRLNPTIKPRRTVATSRREARLVPEFGLSFALALAHDGQMPRVDERGRGRSDPTVTRLLVAQPLSTLLPVGASTYHSAPNWSRACPLV
jgi:hypothetical protein